MPGFSFGGHVKITSTLKTSESVRSRCHSPNGLPGAGLKPLKRSTCAGPPTSALQDQGWLGGDPLPHAAAPRRVTRAPWAPRFRTWQAQSAGAAGEVLESLLPGGRASVPRAEGAGARPSTSLAPKGDNFLQRRCLKTLSEAVDYTEKFKDLCALTAIGRGCFRHRPSTLWQPHPSLARALGPARLGPGGPRPVLPLERDEHDEHGPRGPFSHGSPHVSAPFVECRGESARLMGFERVSILWKRLLRPDSAFIFRRCSKRKQAFRALG